MTQEHINDLENVSLNKYNTFVLTPYVKEITDKCLIYLNAGYPVHLKGPAGTGKTTIAMHIAQILGKPTTIIFGNDDFETSDMVGLQYGFRKKLISDNFIHSVHKQVEDYEQKWMDGRIVDACKNGYTLIYDEFTRSRPETNNVLLSVLEEKVLELPISYNEENKLINVHPEFKAIFTSNPEEYAGVYKSQDALIDRFITIELDFPDEESEISIARAKSSISKESAEKVVGIVRKFRDQHKSHFIISLRDSIKLCKVIALSKIAVRPDSYIFRQTCLDILTSGISIQNTITDNVQIEKDINKIIDSIFKV